MKSSTRFLHIWIACGFSFFSSCSSMSPYPKIKPGERIAVFSFSLDRSIVLKGEKPDSGPGLLNNPKTYYKYHQRAVDYAWNDFRENLTKIYDPSVIIKPQKVINNRKYFSIRNIKSKKISGKDHSPANSRLLPRYLKYISPYDKEVIKKLANAIDAQVCIFIEHKAEYSMEQDSQGKTNKIRKAGTAKMYLYTNVVYVKSNGELLWAKQYESVSDKSATVILKEMDNTNFPKLIISAQKKLFDQMKTDYAKGKKAK